jgi:hypothetical protein
MMPSKKLSMSLILIPIIGILLWQCPDNPVKPDNNTADTTSHNFIWEIDTLGNYGSYLNDVWIVNDTNIWVVGNIETDSGEYNAAHWNGKEWELSRFDIGAPISSIWYFSGNNIWIAGIPSHWDGNTWTSYHLWNMGVLDNNDGGVEKIWASSPSDIYFVGRKGSIVHYDGVNFTKMESGTDTPIVDIWGIDENHIWATAETNSLDDDHPVGYESVTFFCDGQKWSRMYESPAGHTIDYSKTDITGYMSSVWAYKDTLYISSHSGLWKESVKTGKGYLYHGPDNRLNGYPFLVRGTGYNDVYAFTRWGEFLHYNGKSWNRDLSLDGISISKAAVTKELVVMVGDMRFRYVIIIRGHHLN